MQYAQTKDGTILHYRWINSRKSDSIILINSLGTNLMIWDKVISIISSHFNILCFDKRGHGLSSTKEGIVTIDDYADDVIELMDQLKIKKAHVLGLSIGGLITYSLASRYPSRFGKLIFSNTGAKIGSEEAWNERISMIKEKGLSSMSSGIIERWLSSEYRNNNEVETIAYKTMLERNSTLGYIQACEAIRDANYTSVLDKIKHKALFIGGAADLGTTPEFVAEHASKLNKSEVNILEGVGHLPCIEKPEEVANLILEFCQEYIDLYDLGMRTRRSVLGNKHVDRAEANKTDFDIDFQTYIVNSAWGSIWSRPQLTKRERSMITIALLAALGHEEELAMHIRATQNTGASEEDIKEVLLHIGIYAGVPVTNGAMKIAKEVYQKLQMKNDE